MKKFLPIFVFLSGCINPQPDEPIDIVSVPLGQPTIYQLDSITKVHTSQIVNLKKADSLIYWQTVSALITRIAKVETSMSILATNFEKINSITASQILNLKKVDSLMYWQTLGNLSIRNAKVETNMSNLTAKDIRQDTTIAILGVRIIALVADSVYQRNQIIALQKGGIFPNLNQFTIDLKTKTLSLKKGVIIDTLIYSPD